MTIEDRLRQFVLGGLPSSGRLDDLKDDYPLIKNRVIDSMALMQIVTFVEDEFGIEVQDEELVPTNFGTISSIAGLVRQKQSA